MRHPHGLRAAAGNLGFDFLDPANIGLSVEGGFFAGLISHTANGVATHALIVAPAATGASGAGYTITTDLAWQSTGSTTGATSSFNGAANTALMINSPAANFCTGLSLGGFNDWYLPARYEMDIAYFHLKPTTTSNSTSWGLNDYSVPKRTSNYTAGSPTQTSIAAFQFGNTEAFITNDPHWSSTENTSTQAWDLSFNDGTQSPTTPFGSKTTTKRVRAFRRIAL
jgi:hypothetical protein